jgi:hypothetical protein
MLAAVSEVTIAVNPARCASELALTSPMIARLTIARFNASNVETKQLSGSHERATVVGL